jgi:hypothetical protein
MTGSFSALKIGVAFAIVFGLFHAAWAALVGVGLAQAVIDFILRLHFIQPFYVIQPFDVPTAIGLTAFSSLSGFCLGSLFAASANYVRRH